MDFDQTAGIIRVYSNRFRTLADDLNSALHRRALGALLPAIKEKVSGGIIAGLFFVATGFGPDEWFKRLFASLHLSENASAALKTFDPRIGLVGVGVLLIGVDILLRHFRDRRPAPASPISALSDATKTVASSVGTSGSPVDQVEVLSLPDKPSIAVLPFQNLSGDAGQEYFADGMVEDIITALSRFKSLFVIARNSSFTYKGRSVNVRQVGIELGVRYVLEGSVRKSGDTVRITGQLIDATTDAHVWADKFDGKIEDVFALQDQVTSAVVVAIAPAIEKAEYERRRTKPTKDMESYDWYLRGIANLHNFTPECVREALLCFQAAIAIDEEFAAAWGASAWAHVLLRNLPVTRVSDHECDTDKVETERFARRAIALGTNDALVLAWAAHALAYVVHDYDGAVAPAARARALNPNLAVAWMCSAWIDVLCENGEEALEKFEHALRLSPIDPARGGMLAGASWSCFMAGRYEEGLRYAKESLYYRKYAQNLGAAAANAFRLGDMAYARLAIHKWREIDPSITLKDVPNIYPVRGSFPDRISKLLRECGVPD